jgi:hypothetical protein
MLYTIKTDPERAAQPALDAYVESLDWRATLCENHLSLFVIPLLLLCEEIIKEL